MSKLSIPVTKHDHIRATWEQPAIWWSTVTTSVPRVEASSRSSTNCKSVSGIDSPSSSATFLCVKFTPGLRLRPNWPSSQQLKASSGKCMTSSLRIRTVLAKPPFMPYLKNWD